MRKIPAIFVFVIFILFGAALLAKLFYLQVMKGEYYGALALGQQIPVQEGNTKRGDIFFSDGATLLAKTKVKPIVYIFPNKISTENQEAVTRELSQILGESLATTTAELAVGATIKKDLTEEQFKELKQRNLKGIYVDEELVRVYPQKKFAGHLVGFVNSAGQGQYGVEGFYDSVLKGEQVLKGNSSVFSILASAFKEPPSNESVSKSGKGIQLTIDYNIQYEAEKLLEQAAHDWQMDSGQIIVQEPSTGKILAMAVWPDFDPNLYASEEQVSSFTNPALQALFEPGSVFKPITMAAGLEENLVAPETRFTDTGEVNVGGPSIYNFAKKAWGEQSMVGVLENSINTGMVFVEQKLGKNLFLKYAQSFGLFKKTEVDLAGEIYSANETLKKGYPRDFAVASFGQGIQITSLQLLKAISAIANKGLMMRPYIAQAKDPTLEGQVISENTAAQLSAMMVSVVENGGGRRAKVPGYLVAGKTGTAQIPKPTGGYYEDRTIQSFIGFAPANQPRFIILVRLDNPKQSDAASSCAAPIFGQLAKYIIDLWQVPPTQ
ncbi:MAG: penicillin-binding protein 2 [Candidatus Pacebacteria bacterium]|nr:penicillin-binding protein 2 [Candidatus Paceibacterota bacterium]